MSFTKHSEIKVDMPSISIVIPTYNSEKTIEACLESIVNQNYPKDKIEVIIVDGGSKDKTIKIIESFTKLLKVKIVHEKTGRPEAATAIGYNYAKSDLIANIPSDNVLPHNEWLNQMVEPFKRFKEVVATQPLRYSYKRNLGLLDRYFALFGVNDPISYYLNKRDRLSWLEEGWSLLGDAKDIGNFFLVKFNLSEVPTLGANGYIVKREIVQKVTSNVFNFFHIDSNLDLIRMGYNLYGIVKTDIIHQSGEKFLKYFQRRIRYLQIYFRDKNRRRYHLYNPSSYVDKINLLKFIAFSLTMVRPTYDAIKGYKKIPDKAWFLHPIVCFGILFIYAIGTFVQILKELLAK
jgi:glycosyltransferase involved in cell wall biosynthesis